MPGRTTANGYGNRHQALRRRIQRDVIDRGLGVCWRCQTPIGALEAWDLGHVPGPGSALGRPHAGPEHRRCNRSGAPQPTRPAKALEFFDTRR